MTTSDVARSRDVKEGIDWNQLFAKFASLLFLIVLMIIFTLLQPRFLDAGNLLNVLRQVSVTGLIALGMTFVILTGGIDLSIGSLLALAGIVAAIVAKGSFNASTMGHGEAVGYPWYLSMLAAIAVGTLGGAAQGLLITRFRIPPFVVTLGGLSIFRGFTLWVSKAAPISGFPADYRWWGTGEVLGVPVPVILFLVLALLCHIALKYTLYGRAVFAVGGNAEAARLSGINNQAILLSVYMIVGALAGLAGFILSARLNAAEAVAGIGFELTVIAAVIIGGTSLFGGIGSVGGTLIGAVLIGVLVNGLVLNNVSSYVQQIIIGGIIIFAVGFDRVFKSRSG
jgi:inositol transport system permease protein